MIDIKEGDVFRWYYKNDSEYRQKNPSTAYWCMDNQCFAKEVHGVLRLIDTYWSDYDFALFGSHVSYIDPERVDLGFICNLNDTKEIKHYEQDDYDQVYNLSRQKNCYKHYRVDKDATTSKSAIRRKYENKIREAEEKKRSAEWDVEYYNRLIEEL